MLLPEPADDVDLGRLYADVDRPAPAGRPWVLVNMVATVDGGTSIDGRSGPLGGAPDRQVFPNIRAVADVILAAAGTVRAESYGPPRPSASLRAQRRARGQAEVPRLAIVTSSLDLDPGWAALHRGRGPPARRHHRRRAGRPAGRAGRGRRRRSRPVTGRVDLADALGQIAALGAAVVVCEGGPSLNGQLLAGGLVDELCLTLAPLAIAGTSARIAHGPDAGAARAAARAPARGGRRPVPPLRRADRRRRLRRRGPSARWTWSAGPAPGRSRPGRRTPCRRRRSAPTPPGPARAGARARPARPPRW